METLITGGAGYIGSTVASACLDRGITPVILDDLSTGRAEFARGRHLYIGDFGDRGLLARIFEEHPRIGSVVHCAAKIDVSESIEQPLDYYRNNVAKTISLLSNLVALGCERLVFSSSAAVYASPPGLTVDEDSALAPQSPYARTKMACEFVLSDAAAAGRIRALSLRYFNPVGADPKLRTGPADPTPTHVMGKLFEAHRSGRPFVVHGTDWPTRDGSTVRDYIHVWDLADAHVQALIRLDDIVTPDAPYLPVNLGTGRGTTVLELVEAFRRVVGGGLATVDGPRRPGDVVGCYTTSERALTQLRWSASRSLEDAVRDSLAWANARPARLGR